MKCPKCGANTNQVRDSRPSEIDGALTIRRRRICMGCKYRWSTVEIPIGERRHYNAVGLLAKIKEDLQRTITKIDELNRGEVK